MSPHRGITRSWRLTRAPFEVVRESPALLVLALLSTGTGVAAGGDRVRVDERRRSPARRRRERHGGARDDRDHAGPFDERDLRAPFAPRKRGPFG